MKLIGFFVGIITSFCINSSAQSNIKTDCDYYLSELYYQTVYKAEKCLMQNQNDSALKYYTDARKVFGLYQVNDRNNVMICLSNCIDTAMLTEWFRYGYFCSADTIGPEQYMELYHSFIPESLAPNLLETLRMTGKMKWTYIEELEQISQILDPLLVKDQKFRTGEFNNSNDKKTLRKRRKADKQNFATIMSCYKRFGDFSTNRFSGKYKNARSAFKYILMHNFLNTEIRNKYNDFFIRQVACGNVDARVYAEIVDNYLKDSSQVYGCNTWFCYNDTIVVYELSETYKSRINRNRSQIFLQDIETLHQKQVWAWQNYALYSFETLWGIIPDELSDTVREIAEKRKTQMGPMVVGYAIYTR